ncbi:hypothetical protein GYMLUDRAFT_32721 [Collybiopsis luxurians FD-317 M1]|nr:hypothetical protein GYMLUDRAFT_32721 [Collybiopsis luxurians FD-317 M1]
MINGRTVRTANDGLTLTRCLLILLRDNLLPSQSFGFGQCLALVVVIPVLISVIRAFQEFGLRPRHAKTGVNKRGGRRRRRKQLSHEHMVYAV